MEPIPTKGIHYKRDSKESIYQEMLLLKLFTDKRVKRLKIEAVTFQQTTRLYGG